MTGLSLAPLTAVFITVFLAELGDKTQIATLLFAADRPGNPWAVFLAAAAALVASTALAVLAGNTLGRALHGLPIRSIAGVGLILTGLLVLWDANRG